MPLLEVQHLQKVYTSRFGGSQVEALKTLISLWSRESIWPSWASPAPARPTC